MHPTDRAAQWPALHKSLSQAGEREEPMQHMAHISPKLEGSEFLHRKDICPEYLHEVTEAEFTGHLPEH